MKRSLLSTFVAVGVITALGTGPATAAPPEPPEGFEWAPASERAMIRIFCQDDDGNGTCEATRYELGKTPGDSSVGNLGTFSPIGYLFHAAGEGSAFATFLDDGTLKPSYVLRTDEPLTGQISTTGFLGSAVIGADTTVEVEFRATKVGVPGFSLVTLGSATVNKTVVTPNADGQTYEFSIDLPPELDGVEIDNLEMTLWFRSITLLQNGFINGEGGSFFDLPYYTLVPTQQV